MCSLIMPADYEMLISHSPPVFSHSPPTGYLSDYPSMCLSPEAFSHVTRSTCRSPSPSPCTRSFSNFNKFTTNDKMPVSPKRPCLVIRTEEMNSSSDEDPTSPTHRHKKKVVFADAKGMELTHVRIMSEPSNEPPHWSLPYLARVTQGICAEPIAKDEWEITFVQPASDYIQFRKRLDTNRVSLENVIIKQTDELMEGTVKVSNISYEKEVFIRISSDNWQTHEDTFCKYVPSAASNNSITAAYVLYDTFSFNVPIKPNSKRIEFCVGFRCNETEYWDNNDSKNYIINRKMHTSLNKQNSSDLAEQNNNNINSLTNGLSKLKCTDALQAKLDSWSEFASWTHLENTNPYW